MIVSINETDYEMTCFTCGASVVAFGHNDDLHCPDCKVTVAQAGIRSAFEEYVLYAAAEDLKASFGKVDGFVPAKIAKPPFRFAVQQ